MPVSLHCHPDRAMQRLIAMQYTMRYLYRHFFFLTGKGLFCCCHDSCTGWPPVKMVAITLTKVDHLKTGQQMHIHHQRYHILRAWSVAQDAHPAITLLFAP